MVFAYLYRFCRHSPASAFGSAALVLFAGCVLAPPGTKEEQSRLDAVAGSFESPPHARQLPELSQPADWGQVLHRAFLANGELEAAYFDWKAAMTRIDQAAAWPNSNIALSYSYMFSSENMKAWDRSTISTGFDPAMNLSAPVKARTAGKVALESARAAGERFRATKFELQRRVLSAYLDLALTEEKVRIQRDNLTLLKLVAESAANRAQAGGPQQDLLKAQIERELAENDLATLEAEAQSMRVMLNGMLAREPDAPLALPAALPASRPIAADDARLIAMGVEQNPELAGLARQVAGRIDAVELAKLAYLPDFNLSAGFTGSVSQFVGGMVMLPTNVPAIRGTINEAKAMLRSTEAMARQTRRDRAASFVAALYIMRNSERQTQLFQQRIAPTAQQLFNSSRQSYAAGAVGFADLIDSQRTLLDVRRMIAEARIEREKRLAELEALAGTDVETLIGPMTAPATQPADRSAQRP